MTLRSLPLALALLALPALAAGCGDSDGASQDAGPPPVNQCVGPSDIDIVEALVAASDAGLPDGGVPDGGAYPLTYWEAMRAPLSDCGYSCVPQILADDGAEECMNACLLTTGLAGLSEGCVTCQSELTRCVSGACINECLGSDLDLCASCTYENCGDRLAACTGLTVPQ